MRILVLVLGMLLLAPALASGATVTVEPEYQGGEAAPGRIVIADRAGEVNALTIDFERHPEPAAEPDRPVLIVRDDVTPPTPGAGCTSVDARTVRCEASNARIIEVDLGGGADRAHLGNQGNRFYYSRRVTGGDGDDEIVSEAFAQIRGGRGNDRLSGTSESVTVEAGPGDDLLVGGTGSDRLVGGPGNDVLRGGPGRDTLAGGAVALYSDERVPAARAGRDRLDGGPNDDFLTDDDRLSGIEEVGRDVLVGGTGDDTVGSYTDRRRSVVVNLSDRRGDGERGENDALSGLENLGGGRGDDRLTGDGDTNAIGGGPGADVIRGRGGNDHITVERGDRVRGDRGDDVLQARTLFAGRLRCGAGRDKVLLTPAYRRGAIVRGPLLDADCERLELAHSNLTFDPQPTRAAGGALAFRMFVFRCCALGLTLTRDARGFGVVGRAPITQNRVVVPARRASGPILRAVISDRRRGAVVRWRFRAR